MAFNSADTAAFKNVWVFCEQRQGVMMPTTFELISEGRKLADELGVELCGILLGDNVDGIAAELGEYGADKVYVYNSPLLKDFTTDAYTKVIVEAVEEIKPEVLLFGASNIGRDLAPRCAARLHTGLCADCTHLDIDLPNYKNFLKEASTLPEDRINKLGTVMINREPHPVDRDLKMTRPAFGGHLMASIICPRFRPAMATVRPGVMKKRLCKKNVEILHPAFALEASDIHTEVVETVKAAKKLVDLIGADFIVSVGRGISKDVEGGIKLAEELAEVLGGGAELQRILIQMRHCGHCVGQDGLFERQEYIVASIGFPSAFAQILEILPLRSCIRYPGSPIRRVGFLRRREQASRDEQQQRQSAAAKPFGHTMGRLQHSSPPFLFVRSLRGIVPPLILCG